MTPWGEPDLRGTWPLNHLISTPFQRPERFGERRFLTDEEFAAAQKSAEDRNTRFQSGAIPQADAGQATRQTSLMVDPPNGRFPALTPRGKELYDQMRGSYKPGQTVFDTPGRLRQLGSVHHPRPAGVDAASQLQQRHPHHAVPGLRGHPPRDGARGAHHPDHARVRRSTARSGSISESREDAGKATRWSSRRRTSTARPR